MIALPFELDQPGNNLVSSYEANYNKDFLYYLCLKI